MAFVFYRHPRRPSEVSVTIAGSEWAISATVERLEREGNEVTDIIPPPTNRLLQGKIDPGSRLRAASAPTGVRNQPVLK
jgi:hypothetical protein